MKFVMSSGKMSAVALLLVVSSSSFSTLLSSSTAGASMVVEAAASDANDHISAKKVLFFSQFRTEMSRFKDLTAEELEARRPQPPIPHYVPPGVQESHQVRGKRSEEIKSQDSSCLNDPDSTGCLGLKLKHQQSVLASESKVEDISEEKNKINTSSNKTLEEFVSEKIVAATVASAGEVNKAETDEPGTAAAAQTERREQEVPVPAPSAPAPP